MKLFNKKNLDIVKFFKVFGLILVSIILISFTFDIVNSTFGVTFPKGDSLGYESMISYGGGFSGDYEEISEDTRMNQSTSMNAEDFEITKYTVNIETNNLEETNNQITALKQRSDVIFENANGYEKGSYYIFKVENNSAAEILSIIKDLNPKTLNERIYTIERLVDTYVDRIEILKNELIAIEEVLSDAIKAYDDILELALSTQDARGLAEIINGKVSIIEGLTQKRINLNSQIEQLEQAKAEQLDRLNYTYFYISVSEDKLINGEDLKDSWKLAFKVFINDTNKILQGISINLILLSFLIIQYTIYFLIILFVGKYLWKFTKYIWKKK